MQLGNKDFYSSDDAAALGVAWLNAKENKTTNKLFSGLATQARINELKVTDGVSDLEAEQESTFRDLFNELKNNTKLTDSAFFSFVDSDEYNLGAKVGDYLLKADHHVLILRVRNEKGQYNISLYDPNIGEISFSGKSGRKIAETLRTTLHDYLKGKHSSLNTQTRAEYYGVNYKNGHYQFKVFQVNNTQYSTEKNSATLTQLRTFLDHFSTEQQRLAMAPDVKIGNISLAATTLYRMGATIDGQSITSKQLTSPEFAARLRFKADVLSDYLLNMNSSESESRKSLMLLKQQMTEWGVADGRILSASGDPDVTASTEHLLQQVNEHVDNNDIKPALWTSLQNNRPGWQRLNKISGGLGNGMQGYGYFRGIKDLI